MEEREESRTGESVSEAAEPGGEAGDRRSGMEETERVRRLEEEIRRLPVREHLFLMMHSLSDLAVSRLGLVGEPDSGRGLEPDLGQARLAIEAFRALLAVVETAGSSEEIGPRRALLAQLQLAYAAAVKAETARAPGQAEEKPGTAEAAGSRSSESGAGEPKSGAAESREEA